LLLKSRGSAAQGQLLLGSTRAVTGFTSRPLFHSIGLPGKVAAGAAAPQWSVVTFDRLDQTPNPWDACHALISQGSAIAPGGVDFVEPDLVQQWPVKQSPTGNALTATREGEPHPQDSDYPTESDNFWFRDAEHGQFAIAQSGLRDPVAGVRIAHLYTGYDPDHSPVLSISAPMNNEILPMPPSQMMQGIGLLGRLTTSVMAPAH
jgi:hypothetical protein